MALGDGTKCTVSLTLEIPCFFTTSTLVECPHLKRTKTMHFHSFLPPPTGYLPESDVQALLMAIELMGETT